MDSLRDYILEMCILLLGLLASVIELLWVTDRNLGVVILVLSTLLALATLSIRREMYKKVKPISSLLPQVPLQWREDAAALINNLDNILAEWSGETRKVSRADIITYEMKIVRKATQRVTTLHNCLTLEDLLLWLPGSVRSFRKYAECYRSIPRKIEKKRIFVCNRVDILRDAKVETSVRGIFDEQLLPVKDGGLGMNARVLWRDLLVADQIEVPGSFLIVDERETFLVKGSESSSFVEAEAIVNPTLVRNYAALYNTLWDMATPIENILSSQVG